MQRGKRTRADGISSRKGLLLLFPRILIQVPALVGSSVKSAPGDLIASPQLKSQTHMCTYTQLHKQKGTVYQPPKVEHWCVTGRRKKRSVKAGNCPSWCQTPNKDRGSTHTQHRHTHTAVTRLSISSHKSCVPQTLSSLTDSERQQSYRPLNFIVSS